MADPSIVKEWLDKADEDFRFAEANLWEGSEFFSQICFHFQQAAEKYLKAYIIGKGLAFDKVHDLVRLLKTCSAHESAFAGLKEDCILLNAAYIETRYPVHWPTSYTKETAEQAHAAALNIAKTVRDHLEN
ncbi:HEPN domain-containing protein [Geobacter sp.]|uniref:HEPN domain-containing protein n=1 Tax=Geobacter sp. TaxID=46610 RepID=UPI002637C33F|nr:HEPN domain-containing protein [Geobacter sp.]